MGTSNCIVLWLGKVSCCRLPDPPALLSRSRASSSHARRGRCGDQSRPIGTIGRRGRLQWSLPATLDGMMRRSPGRNLSASALSRNGNAEPQAGRNEFRRRFLSRFQDPVFSGLRSELDKIARSGLGCLFQRGKAPITRKAGTAFKTRLRPVRRLARGARRNSCCAGRHSDRRGPARILLISGSSRSETHLSRRNVEILIG